MINLDRFANAGKTIGIFLKKNSSAILTGLGVTGLISTAVASGKAAIKAHDVIYDYEDLEQMKLPPVEMCSDNDKYKSLHFHASFKEKLMLTWKFFIPPVILGGVSAACIIGAHKTNHKKTAALASAYALAEKTISDYQDKIVENFDVKGLTKIKEDIAEKHISENPPGESCLIIPDKAGDILCYDTVSGRYFKSDMETLRRIQNDINSEVINTMWSSLNDFYYILGLETLKIGDDLGWTPDHKMDISFTSKLTEKGEPVMVIDYAVSPFNYI